MKKYLMCVLTAFIFVGCGVGISDAALEATGLKGAPKWVIANKTLYSAVGDAPIIDKNVNFAKNEAEAAARAGISKQIGVKVSSFLEKDGTRRDKALNEQVVSKITEETSQLLVNTQPSAIWIPDDGSRIYVLMEMSEESVNQIRKLAKEAGLDVAGFEKYANSPQSAPQTTQDRSANVE